jgi:hypothetical protein
MPVKGMKQVRSRLKAVFDDVSGERMEKAIYVALTVGSGYAQLMTPMDTSTLVNSRFTQTGTTNKGAWGKAGYTAAYAAAVHAASGKLKGLPRVNSSGNYWDPSGEPEFLSKGFEDNLSEIHTTVKEVMKL